MNCQLVQVVIAPPSSTPAATPRLPTAPHIASAVLRCAPAYVVMISDRADGVSSAALRPWIDRVAMSWPPVSAKPLSSEAAVKRPSPVRKTVAPREQVGDAAAEQEAAAGHHQVRRDQPLQLAAVEAQGAPDRGQGGVDDRDVEDDEDLGGEGDAEQGPGLLRPVSCSRVRGAGRSRTIPGVAAGVVVDMVTPSVVVVGGFCCGVPGVARARWAVTGGPRAEWLRTAAIDVVDGAHGGG